MMASVFSVDQNDLRQSPGKDGITLLPKFRAVARRDTVLLPQDRRSQRTHAHHATNNILESKGSQTDCGTTRVAIEPLPASASEEKVKRPNTAS
jgi:hypothetical protein